MKILQLSLIFVLTFGACKTENNGKRNIRKFYFPIAELNEGLVYEYQSINNDSFPPVYWYYRNAKKENDLFLIGTSYSPRLEPQQLVTEIVLNNGMLTENLFLFYPDTLGKNKQITVNIESGSAFPFLVEENGGIFLYKVSWVDPEDSQVSTTLIKNRRFLGDTTYVYQGQTYDAVIFSVKELIEQRAEGSLEIEYNGQEIYAKDLGLVHYKKEIQGGLAQEYQLVKTYSMKTLEEKFRKTFE